MNRELVEIVRCKNCIHRPIVDPDRLRGVDPPKNIMGWDDYTCPCLNEEDGWYSWNPGDDFFCKYGEG